MRKFVAPGDEFLKRRGANLPHWTQAGVTYFVTFRLADSLPAGVLEGLRRERDERLEIAREKRGADAAREIEREFLKQYQGYLDRGVGACWMRDDAVAKIVADAIGHFEGERYDLWAWCVMPNHVHAVVQPGEGNALSDIMHSWKSFTAKEINKVVGRQGVLWQHEPFDHAVRSWEYLRKFVGYTWDNPEKAGLRGWKWRWKWEEGAEGSGGVETKRPI